MNYGEEQKNELEALSEIYFNEIKIISSEQPISFSIKVRTQASNFDNLEEDHLEENLDKVGGNNSESDYDEDEDEDDGDNEYDNQAEGAQGTSVELKFDLPLNYPDERPSIHVLNSTNLNEDELIDLMDLLSQKSEESLGTVMVFSLVSDAVEWLISKTDEEAVEIEQERERKQQEVEAEEKKRFEGTPVTEATFLAWKAKFDAELLKAKLDKQKQSEQSDSNSKRLTGRAMFESDKTLAESDLDFVADLDQNQLEALLQNIDEDGDEFVDEDFDDGELDTEEDDDEEYDLENDSGEEDAEQEVQKSSNSKINSKR